MSISNSSKIFTSVTASILMFVFPSLLAKNESVERPSCQISENRRSNPIRGVHHTGPRLSISKRRSSSLGSKARLAEAQKLRTSSHRRSYTVDESSALQQNKVCVVLYSRFLLE